MSNFTENEIIPFALSIIQSHKEGIDTKNLIIHLRELMNPYGEDLEILTNRNDDKFSQKVRNLKSHKTLENKGFVSFNNNKFYITKVGTKFLIESQNYFKDINILDEWVLTTRTYNSLKDNGIKTLSELLEWSEKKFLTIPNFGKAGISEINNYLSPLNLKLGTNLSEMNKRKIKSLLNEKKLNEISLKEKNKISKVIINEKSDDFKLLSMNILQDWPLSVRTFNALKNENIIFVGDLISYDRNSLLRIKNFGKNSLEEINKLMEQYKINKIEDIIDISKWDVVRNQLILKNKEKKLNNIIKQNNFIGINKSIFKNFEKFKEESFNFKKIVIDQNIKTEELEELIIDDIQLITSILNDRSLIFFCGRYGYKENYKTLEELGKKSRVTRERVRQIENYINLSLVKLGKIDKETLINFFNKYEYISFHKLFPKLDELFTNTAKSTGEITRDKLTVFLENYCGVKEEYFKTPERELWHFDSSKLSEIFTFTPSGISLENFLEIIKDNYGYNDFLAKSSLDFMKNNNLIKIIDNKIYPLKLNKIYEIANILASFPNGLHWKKVCEIGNNSHTENKWNLQRLVGDFSLTLKFNHFIYHSDRGTLKLIKFCNLLNDINQVLDEILNIYNDNYRDQISLDFLFKEIKNKNNFKNINFYDLRMIIKIFGEEKGIYFHGKSHTNIVSLIKNFKAISIKDRLIDIFKKTNYEVNLNQIKDVFLKDSNAIDARLDELVDEMKIFKINPGTYINYENGIKLCDKNNVIFKINELLSKHSIITNSFIRETLNDEFDYNHSIFYYNSLIKIFSLEENWFHKEKFLSKEKFNPQEWDEKIKNLYDINLNINENYSKISKNLGISMLEVMNLRRELSEHHKIN